MIRIAAIIISAGALSFVLYILLNRKHKSWSDMTENERNRNKIALTGGIIVFLAGLLTALFIGKKK